MKYYCTLLVIAFIVLFNSSSVAQKVNFKDGYPNSIKPVGIIKGIDDTTLLEVIQRQTFRYFWHFAHPVSGLARERSNTIRADYFWDYANDPTIKTTIARPLQGSLYEHSYPEFFTPLSRNYEIRVIAYSGDNCLNTSSQNITLKATPQLVFNPVNSICANAASFMVSANLINALPGNGVFSGNKISAAGMYDPGAAGAGKHTIRYTYSASNGCSNYKEQTITVFPTPGIDAGPDRFILEGGSGSLQGSGTGNNISYNWSPATWLNKIDTSKPIVTPTDDIIYTLTVTSADGCSVTDEVLVKVLKSPLIPNTFSPNGDGIHDKWEIKYLETYPGCTIEIYNRYGQLVFQSIGYNKPWDGTFKDKPLPAGTYYYLINPKNGRKQMSGFVDIIR